MSAVAHIRDAYHPNAYLQHVKSVKSGLSARTKLLNLLENQPLSTSKLARKAEMSYSSARYHLRLLAVEGRVSARGKRPCVWTLTGFGQKRLDV